MPVSTNPSTPQLFPNPNHGIFKLMIPASFMPVSKHVRLEIYDQSGKLYFQQVVAVRSGGIEHELNLHGWRSGNYWLRCSDGKQWNYTNSFRIQ